MTTRIWRGDAQPVIDQWQVVPTAPEEGDLFRVKCNNKWVEYEAGVSPTPASVAAGLAALIGEYDNTIPEFAEMSAVAGTADDGTPRVVISGPEDGKYITITTATTDGNISVTVVETETGYAGLNEKQQIVIGGVASGGTFTITFDGQTTAAIAYNANAAAVQSALEALSNIAVGDVTVTTPGLGWVVEFKGVYLNADVPLMTANGASLTGIVYGVNVRTLTQGYAGLNEIQLVEHISTSGTYTLTFDGQTTGAIAYDASAATIQTALEALSNIAAGDVTVTERVTGTTTRQMFVEFKQAYRSVDVPLLLGNGSSLDGGTSVIAQELVKGRSTQNTIISVQAPPRAGGGSPGQPNPPVGYWALRVNPENIAATPDQTPAIPNNASIALVSQLLNQTTPGYAGSFEVLPESVPGFYYIELKGRFAGLPMDVNTSNGAYNISDVHADIVQIQEGGAVAVNEQQKVSLIGGPTGGTFTLTFKGQTTGAIAYNASAATLDTALEALSTIDTVTVTGNAGGPWTIEFTGAEAAIDQPLLTGDVTNLTGGNVNISVSQSAVDYIDEVQEIRLTPTPAGGTFTLTYSGQTTAGIAYNADAATVSAALVALSNIGVGDVELSGNAGGPWVVTFRTALAGTNVAEITGSGASLTGANVSISTIQEADQPVNEVQTITMEAATSGTWTITFDGDTTAAIPFNADGDIVAVALNNALGVGSVNASGPAGGPWIIEFIGAYAAQDVALATVNSSSLSGAGTQTLTATRIQTPTGPNYFDDPYNWEANATPGNGDDLVFDHGDVDCLYNIREYQSGVSVPVSVFIEASYEGEIGLRPWNGSYYEYRELALRIPATRLIVGQGDGAGSGFMYIDTDGVATDIQVWNTGEGSDGYAALNLTSGANTGASQATMAVYKGSVGIATALYTDAFSLSSLNISYVDNIDADAVVSAGYGATITVVKMTGGSFDWERATSAAASVTSFTMSGGTARLSGQFTITTIAVNEGVLFYDATGTVTTLHIGNKGEVYRQRRLDALTITNTNIHAGATFIDPAGSITFTNNIALIRCSLPDVTLDLGEHITIQRGAGS